MKQSVHNEVGFLRRLFARVARREDGFTMVTAVTALMVGTLLSLAAWATANSDINFTDKDKWGRVAYQRAQTGISDYVQHMAEDSGFWKSCDRPDGVTGNGLGQTALNDNDFGASDHPQRRWLPWSTAGSAMDRAYSTQYTIDLQPRSGNCKPSASAQDRMIDPASGTFKIAVTGRAGPLVPSTVPDSQVEAWRQTNWKRVTVVAEFRRNGFLDYGYFTDKEGKDPALQTSLPDPTLCDAYYQDDPGYNPSVPLDGVKPGRYRASSCGEIQFADADKLQGPFHTNDSIYLESNDGTGALFGNPNKGDRIEVYNNNKTTCAYRDSSKAISGSDCSSSASAIRKSAGVTVVPPGPQSKYLDLPESNSDLVTYADPYSGDPDSQGYTFLGKTTIVLNSDNTFTVTNSLVNGGTATTYNFPTSGVIWVANNGVSSCTSNPYTAKYPGINAGCALVEVKGTYNKSLTIGSEADIVITGNVQRGSSPTAVLGLIANQYVRVRHYAANSSDRNYGSSCSYDSVGVGTTKVSTIQAAVLALQHSFTVDGFSCGNNLGWLNFTGALAQRFRGTVGQGVSVSGSSCTGGSGYCKNYVYDYTFKSQTPPHFLAPNAATWKIIRLRQTLPACDCTITG
jgi:Tfp pilus assembly protein PilX